MGRTDEPLNDPHEAYTGNHIGHKERGALPKHDTASLIYKADGDVIHSTEAETKDSLRARIWKGLPVSEEGRGMYEEKHYGTWEALMVPEKQSGRRNQREEGGEPKTSGSHTHS